MSSVRSVSKSGNASSFVKKYLVVEGLPCYRHCDKPTRFASLVDDRKHLVGAYICPDNYVSRIVYFELQNEGDGMDWFKSFVRNELDGGSIIRDKDFRTATRHGWELGRDAENEIKSISNHSSSRGLKEYYWTFYPRNDDEKKNGNYLCDKCGKLFTQPNSAKNKTCRRH